jgi:hypothetical protein
MAFWAPLPCRRPLPRTLQLPHLSTEGRCSQRSRPASSSALASKARRGRLRCLV